MDEIEKTHRRIKEINDELAELEHEKLDLEDKLWELKHPKGSEFAPIKDATRYPIRILPEDCTHPYIDGENCATCGVNLLNI